METICVVDVVAIWIFKEFTHIDVNIVEIVAEAMDGRIRVTTVLPRPANIVEIVQSPWMVVLGFQQCCPVMPYIYMYAYINFFLQST